MTIEEGMLKWAENAKVTVKTNQGQLLFPVEGECGSWLARVNAIEEDDLLFIVTAYPFQVAESARADAMVALAEMTSQMKLGAFYMDPSDGQINFRLGQKIPSGEERESWIGDWIMVAMQVTDTYYRRIMALAAAE